MIRLADLRRHAVSRSLSVPTSLAQAVAALGFVQADPIRAPARAQDLILRHRVRGYREGDLEAHYPQLPLDEEYFVNYGFLPSVHLAHLHPRANTLQWDARQRKRAASVLDFVRERGEAHPRAVAAAFAHGRVTNYWGGSSNATTHMLDRLHYLGELRVARRDKGVRVYALRPPLPDAAGDAGPRAEALLRLIVQTYAPLPDRTLTQPARRCRRLRWRDRAGFGRSMKIPVRRMAPTPPWCACSRHSIRWSGTGAASSSCGVGLIGSRHILQDLGAATVITRCPCAGGTA